MVMLDIPGVMLVVNDYFVDNTHKGVCSFIAVTKLKIITRNGAVNMSSWWLNQPI